MSFAVLSRFLGSWVRLGKDKSISEKFCANSGKRKTIKPNVAFPEQSISFIQWIFYFCLFAFAFDYQQSSNKELWPHNIDAFGFP
jgi:hypothetical protein